MNNQCTYCGSFWELRRDHVIPQSALREAQRKFRGDWLVPACEECNNLLGSERIFTVPERAAYLIPKYLNRYRNFLNHPVWSEEELEEVSDNFRRSILETQRQQQEIKNRVEILNLVAAMPLDYLED